MPIDNDLFKKLSPLISRIYDAALNPNLWEPIMLEIGDAVDGTTGVLVLNTENTPFVPIRVRDDMYSNNAVKDSSPVLAKYTNYPVKILNHYMKNFFLDRDIWYHKMREQSIDERVKIGSHMIATEKLIKTPFYKEVLEPSGGGHLLACFLDQVGESAFSMSRTISSGDFDGDQIQFFSALIPHLRKAFVIHSHIYKLKTITQGAVNALNHSSSAIFVLNQKRQLIFSNDQAKEILKVKDGISLSLNGELEFHPCDNNEKSSQKAIADALVTVEREGVYPGGAFRVFRKTNKSPYHVIVTPLVGDNELFPKKAAVGVFVYDQERNKKIPGEMLISLYGLTPSEAQVLQLFYEFNDLKKIAEALNLSMTTVRTHFYKVLSKTKTSSQVELTKLLCGLPQK